MKLYILLLLFALDPSNTTEDTTTDETTEADTPTTPTTAEDISIATINITLTTEAETASTTTTEAETASTTTTEAETVSTTTTEPETASTTTTEAETASTTTTEAETASTTTTEAETASTTTTEAETASTQTTAGKSTPTAAKTTQQPSIKQNFTCQDGTTTKFRLTGSFALSITYNTHAGLTTVPIEVPQTNQSNDSCCNSSTESLTFDFFNGWSITYIFQGVVSSENQLLSAPDKYYISNITVVYVHDEHLPNSITQDAKVESKFSQVGYLEANSDGYYTCQASIALKMNDNLTLTTTDFKYKAFNDKGDINLDSGTVTECPSDEGSSSSIVAIAAGAAVAGLVIIVVIAYLIWRKRSRKRRYEHALMWAGTSDNLDDS
ncbi:hypothetical protein BsWGS_09101 [Bradybaena similaris]